MKNVILKVESFTAKYEKKEILKNINVSFERGKIHAIIGANGTGKSTLLKAIANNTNKGLKTTGEIIGSTNIAYLDQKYESTLLPWFSVKKNLQLPSIINKEEKFIDFEETINILGLKNKFPIDKKIHQLSGGQKQMTALVRTVSLNRELLILDEPFSNLDYNIQIKIINNLRKWIKKNNFTAIVVLHDFNLAAYFSDIVIPLVGSPAQSAKPTSFDHTSNESIKAFLEKERNEEHIKKLLITTYGNIE